MPGMIPVSWAQASAACERGNYQNSMRQRTRHNSIGKTQGLDESEYVSSQQAMENENKVAGSEDQNQQDTT